MEPQNREQRRHPEKLEREERPLREPHEPESSRHDPVHDGSRDTSDPRAKSAGHGKKTADKWNQ